MSRRDDYEWTLQRLVFGGVIVAAGAVAIGAMTWRQFREGPIPGRRAEVKFAQSRDPLSYSLEYFNTEDLILSRDQIRFGGVLKDRIPSLVEPEAVPAAGADFVDPDARVVGVTVGDESRAYPVGMLMWHEVINDTLADVPIAVIYCPLCDSASVVDRRLDDQTYTFGVSGLLRNSNVLMYDRTDDALWSQLGGQAVSGPNAGKTLRHLPWSLTTFGAWTKSQPDSTVVSFETGWKRDYTVQPYGDYFESDRLMFPIERHDDRLPVKEQVVGVQVDGNVKAYPVQAIVDAPDGRVRDSIAGQTIVLECDGDGGVRVVEAPDGAQIVHTFWFAWAAFYARTEVWGSHQPSAISHQ
ncbi:MAG: DUF3179 domain-containing protein [Planctomycetota bacterium]|jgi:hypothetical protein